ncbi:MAG: hypothetical protein GY816_10050 [Cytophagales bacterium]|nr:hypothetical protein [Cytophagales bacterium]
MATRAEFTLDRNSLTAGPFEYIYVQFEEGGGYGPLGQIGKGARLKLPAIYAYMLFNNESTLRIMKGARVALDIGLFALGVGEVNAALKGANAWRMYVAISDLGVSIVDFNVNNTLNSYLESSPSGREFIDDWNAFMLYYGIAAAGESVLQGYLNNLRFRANRYKTQREILDESGELRYLSDQDIDDLEKIVDDIETETGMRANASQSVFANGGDVSKYGQKLDEIGEVLENGLVKGKYSKRTFNPNNVGGAIKNLDYANADIVTSGISDIEKHLKRLDPDDWNVDMIKRLEDIEAGKIQATDFDKKFYTHELRELERARASGLDDVHKLTNEEWNDLHSATLEDYELFEKMDYGGENIYSLYHPSVQK